MNTQSDRLHTAAVQQAQSIESKWHWLIGSSVILSGLAVAELSSASEISMAYGLLALLSGILSKQCLAVLWPNAYIWLAKRFAWAMDKPESAAPDVVFEHNPQHKHPAVVVWRTSESI